MEMILIIGWKMLKIIKNIVYSINMRLNYFLGFILLAFLALFNYVVVKQILEDHKYMENKRNNITDFDLNRIKKWVH